MLAKKNGPNWENQQKGKESPKTLFAVHKRPALEVVKPRALSKGSFFVRTKPSEGAQKKILENSP